MDFVYFLPLNAAGVSIQAFACLASLTEFIVNQ